MICRLIDEQPQVDGHADGGEEQPEQQALERLDVGLELVAVGRFSQQRAGDEGAERGRNARLLHEDGDADDGQQRGRRHRLLDACQRDEPQEMIEHEVAGDDDDRDEAEALRAGEQIHLRRGCRTAAVGEQRGEAR